jgi:nitrate/nitrite-specific signal transduction histidine kinase
VSAPQDAEIITAKRSWSITGAAFRTLRAQLVLRTLLPIGLLVVAFAVVGQIGYTQVTESLVKARDTDLAAVQAARVGDYLVKAVQALRQVADSPVLLDERTTPIYYLLRDEPLTQHFDLVQASDREGKVLAASDATTGGAVIGLQGFESIQQSGQLLWVAPGRSRDGRPALVITAKYQDQLGAFAGVVEGVIYLGSPKLGAPLSQNPTSVSTTTNGQLKSAFSYIVAGDGTILWHPETELVGTASSVEPLRSGTVTEPSAIITRVDGDQSIIGYAPLNVGRLLPRAAVYASWVQWHVVTQERWNDVVAPINSLLFGLLALALVMFLASIVLVARSAGTLTRPVAMLVAASRALSAGRLRHRLDISGPIEIEQLSEQFNSMADQLQASYSDLENKVAERTQALAEANGELERRLIESQLVQHVAANIAGTVGLDEILRVIASSAAEALDAEGAIVFLPCDDDATSICVATAWNLPYMRIGTKLAIENSLTGITFATGQPQTSHKAAGDPRVDLSRVGQNSVRSILSVPLISQGQITGVLNAVNKKKGRFTDDDLRLLRLLADQTAVAIERARLYADAQRQVRVLQTINELALSITVSRSVEQTMLQGMEHIGKLLGASGAVVYLYNERTRTLDYATSFQLEPIHLDMLLKTIPTIHVEQPAPHRISVLDAFHSQTPVQVADMSDPGYMDPWWDHYEGIVPGASARRDELHLGAMVALPLTVRDKRLGTMGLYFAQPRVFDDADLQLYESFAKILGLAVYNTQLVATAGKLATVEERARLARELHDSVTQSLFSLNLTLRAAKRVLVTDQGEAIKLIDNVHELAQGSLAEMRALIFELRPQALENEGLALALQKHADAVRARSGLNVHLSVTGDRRLPIDFEEALYQIAREALHNVVKHAQARDAWIDLDLASDDVTLAIRDNGRGFDVAKLRTGGGSHIGTSTMRERAEAIHGILDITSEPGSGTEVRTTVSIPPGSVPDDPLTGASKSARNTETISV